MEKLLGNYRAKVVNNKDPSKFGRVLVWIPDVMPRVSPTKGIWARPANNPIGGRNLEENSEHHYMGSSYIPKIGSWVFVFFEAGNINRPYYFGALDLENAKVLPENQVGSSYEDKWTIFKSHAGRCIVISDDPDDERVEVTSKKRQLSSPPSGDTDSVYTIDGNQTTILLDERSGKEKVLIRTRQGDFFHIDIDERKLQAYFQSDIIVKTDGSIFFQAAGDVNIKATGSINEESASDVNVKAAGNISEGAAGDINIKAAGSLKQQASGDISSKAAGNINSDGAMIVDQGGASVPAGAAGAAAPANPEGSRDT